MQLAVLAPADLVDLTDLHLDRRTPLWFYALREAQVRADGQHLGPVGGPIVDRRRPTVKVARSVVGTRRICGARWVPVAAWEDHLTAGNVRRCWRVAGPPRAMRRVMVSTVVHGIMASDIAGVAFIDAGHAAVRGQPCEGALDRPPARDHGEAVLCGGLAYGTDGDALDLLGPVQQATGEPAMRK
jgi:hypothetical protein